MLTAAHIMALTALVGLGQVPEMQFEKLGTPIVIRELGLAAVTHDPDGYDVAWGMRNVAGAGDQALVGIRLDNGETIVHDVAKYGASKTTAIPGADGNVYVYTGNPAHFLRCDAKTREVADLGVPVKQANYFGAYAMSPANVAYIGSYPATALAWVDTKTGEIGGIDRVAEDSKEQYIISCAVADDGWVYCGVGLHHMELWAVNPQTKEKKQILPEKLLAFQGNPTVWTADDGKVYGRAKDTTFQCSPAGVAEMEAPAARPRRPLKSGDWTVGSVNANGQITLTNAAGEKKPLQTAYEGRPGKIHSVAAEHNGLLYGSSLLPGNMFTVDTKTGKLTDLGIITTGPLQVYDIITRPQGLFIGTYMGSHVDVYKPDLPLKPGENPKYLGRAPGMERPMQWCLGPDGMLYTGNMPAKGRLGGSIMQINPDTGALARDMDEGHATVEHYAAGENVLLQVVLAGGRPAVRLAA